MFISNYEFSTINVHIQRTVNNYLFLWNAQTKNDGPTFRADVVNQRQQTMEGQLNSDDYSTPVDYSSLEWQPATLKLRGTNFFQVF